MISRLGRLAGSKFGLADICRSSDGRGRSSSDS